MLSVDVSNLELRPKAYLSNRNIKAYVEEKYGFKVHDQYIAQIRGKLGIKYHEGYNKTEVHTRKVANIENALFGTWSGVFTYTAGIVDA